MSLVTNRIVVLICTGQISSEDDATALSNQVCGYVDEGIKAVILIVNGITFVNTRGLGQLVSSHTNLKNHNARLCLVGVQKRVNDTLETTGLDKVLEIYTSLEEAFVACSDR